MPIPKPIRSNYRALVSSVRASGPYRRRYLMNKYIDLIPGESFDRAPPYADADAEGVVD